MIETIAALAMVVASFFGVNADNAAQAACDIVAKHYGTDIVCVYGGGSFEVFAD